MNKRLAFILIIFMILFFVSIPFFVNRNKGVVHAVGGYPFNISLGQRAIVEPNQYAEEEETFYVAFLDVLEDSRCPSDVQCAQEGKIVLSFLVEGDKGKKYVNLTQHGSQKGLEPALFDPHGTIRLIDVDPYPISAEKIEKKKYIALVVVADA